LSRKERIVLEPLREDLQDLTIQAHVAPCYAFAERMKEANKSFGEDVPNVKGKRSMGKRLKMDGEDFYTR